jgi:squalene-associated FAD-dependent desaturase
VTGSVMASPAAGSAGASRRDRPGRHVVVIGGGLAGITAAITLGDAGVRVTLLEARPRLGGATSSFSRGELTIDTGQHVFLRCCTSYRELLARLGVTGSVTLQDRFDVTVLSPGGGQARLRASRLPGPLQLGTALAGYRFLTGAERLRVARAAIAMRALDAARPGLDQMRLGDWLSARGQSEQARRRLWDLFIVSTLNVAGDEASVPLAATVLKTALLGAAGAADIGMATVPLGALHGRAALSLLGRLGAEVRLGAKAASVTADAAGGFRIELTPDSVATQTLVNAAAVSETDGTPAVVRADGVILAVPAAPAARLAGAAGVAGAASWPSLGWSPIVNVHVIYDRRVTRLPFAAAIESPVQWVFDKTKGSGLRAGQYVSVSLSAADSLVDVPVAMLRTQFLPALEDLFPAAGEARVTDFFVTRERRATFRQVPGSAALRPPATTTLPGLVLAGAWTDTGWPDTMEGAVRSGRTAAQELITALARRSEREPAGSHR